MHPARECVPCAILFWGFRGRTVFDGASQCLLPFLCTMYCLSLVDWLYVDSDWLLRIADNAKWLFHLLPTGNFLQCSFPPSSVASPFFLPRLPHIKAGAHPPGPPTPSISPHPSTNDISSPFFVRTRSPALQFLDISLRFPLLIDGVSPFFLRFDRYLTCPLASFSASNVFVPCCTRRHTTCS